MKDLLFYVADADMEAFLRSVIERIREVSYDIKRHPLRDSGMIQSGAELARMEKGNYEKVILMFDYHGSGREHKLSPKHVRDEMRDKLDSYTWKGKNDVIVLVPELERWLWFCETAILKHYKITKEQLHIWVEEMAEKTHINSEELKSDNPKGLFEYVVKEKLHKTISPRDFERIGNLANIPQLCKCSIFNALNDSIKDK